MRKALWKIAAVFAILIGFTLLYFVFSKDKVELAHKTVEIVFIESIKTMSFVIDFAPVEQDGTWVVLVAK